jgi:bifunctional ADP-heptose synthase (sugar kinase/adenylyltransferase)
MKDILVVGDSCLDIFVYCDANRICPDVPVPVLNYCYQTENPGMAKNVQRNIESLGISCDIVTSSNWHEMKKTRYVHKDSNHYFFRLDSEPSLEKIDINNLNLDYKMIVISDYNKGFISEEDIERICLSHDCVFIDTKKVIGSWIDGAKIIKINNKEYNASKNYIDKKLRDKVVRTMGSLGAEYKRTIYPVTKSEVRDVSGAGDSFMAGLCCNYIKTENIVDSIIFANKCASEVVKHRGVTVPDGITL